MYGIKAELNYVVISDLQIMISAKDWYFGSLMEVNISNRSYAFIRTIQVLSKQPLA